MSKTVTIPTDGMNPFVVTHNGEKYVFTPGEEVEVSDGVALEIEEYKRWRNKYFGEIEPPYEGGGEIEALTVSENGTYTPPEGVDGYAPVTVNVVPPASDIDALIDGSLTEITSNAESVREYACYKCEALTSVDFPNATKVSTYAFYYCKALNNVSFPLVTSIDSNAFAESGIRALTSANFPLVTSIDSNAFNRCLSLKTVALPNVITIGYGAFQQCMGMVTADFPLATSIDNYAFSNCESLGTVNMPSLTKIGSYAFRSSALTIATFPLVTSMSYNAFSQCGKLTKVNFPILPSIASNAFESCSLNSVDSADFPLVTTIGSYGFYQCTKLTSADFPSATLIGNDAFRSCYALTSTNFPLVTSINSSAFSSCSSLTAVILRSETMCTLANTNAFTNCYHFHGTVNATYNPDGLKDGYIYVPRALIEDYKAATNWVTFADRFRALEDYTVDGTTTGELDESKVSL